MTSPPIPIGPVPVVQPNCSFLIGTAISTAARYSRKISGQSRTVISAEATTADGPTPSTVRIVFQVPGKGKR